MDIFTALRKPLCWLSLCPFTSMDDDTGCWGQCIFCGKRAGFVSRAELRAYADRQIDRELRRREALSQPKEERG